MDAHVCTLRFQEPSPDIDASQDVAASPGDQTSDIALQLQQLPADASHLIVSVGGNDALEHLPLLTEPARSVAEVREGER